MVTGLLRTRIGQNLRKAIRAVQSIADLKRAPAISEEPRGPLVKTNIPGPVSLRMKAELDKIQNAFGVNFFVDAEISHGNYVVDADGNVILDAFMMVASLPLGYNHPAMIEAYKRSDTMAGSICRPALGFYPTMDYLPRLHSALLSVAPKGMKQVQTMMCGATANENAIKTAMIAYRTKQRGGASPSEAELQSALHNQPPGCPSLSVLSFENAFHGRMFACLSASRSKAIHKVDLPAFDWPMAPFPKYKYPLDRYIKENKAEDARCLREVDKLISLWNYEGKPVTAMLVEPIQAEGGDNYASTEFFCELRNVAKKHGCAFIVDEVQTGCGATGRMWAHEEWNLPEPPDIVTFSKKMLLGGFYYRDHMRVKEPYRIFNTWMGDPNKLALLEAVVNTIKTENLLQLVRESGSVLMKGLGQLQQTYPSVVSDTRGKGTFVAFNVNNVDVRKKILDGLLQRGVQLGYCGETAIRFRPALIFQPSHAELCLSTLNDVLAKLKR